MQCKGEDGMFVRRWLRVPFPSTPAVEAEHIYNPHTYNTHGTYCTHRNTPYTSYTLYTLHASYTAYTSTHRTRCTYQTGSRSLISPRAWRDEFMYSATCFLCVSASLWSSSVYSYAGLALSFNPLCSFLTFLSVYWLMFSRMLVILMCITAIIDTDYYAILVIVVLIIVSVSSARVSVPGSALFDSHTPKNLSEASLT